MPIGSIKQRLSSYMIGAARDGITHLDPTSICARDLTRLDVDEILTQEVGRICEAATIREVTRAGILLMRLRNASEQEKITVRKDLKKMMEDLVARVEERSGQLKIPQSCRRLLMELL